MLGMSSVTARCNSNERAGLLGFATLLRVDGVIQPQDLVRCQKLIYLLKELLWIVHKVKLELSSCTDSCFSMGMAVGCSPSFPATCLAGHLLPLCQHSLSQGSSPTLCSTTLWAGGRNSLSLGANAGPDPVLWGRMRWH